MLKRTLLTLKRPVLIALTLATAAYPVFAALGGNVDTVVADQARLRATRNVVARNGFEVHEMSRADGGRIREYVSPAGSVFGVAWDAPTLPDLSQLLGSNFAQFQSNLHTGPGRRNVAVVHVGNLVVESSGRMRSFHGRAYLNSELPSGVTQEAIQ